MKNSSKDDGGSLEWSHGIGNEQDVTVISNCYCANCDENHATTTMLPMSIPFFREIIIMSLSCPECHFRNSGVTFGGEIQEQGERIRLQVREVSDLDRQIVKSDSATLSIPQLEFEIPATTQQGTVSTLEGMLKRAASNLETGQSERLQLGDLDNFYRCQSVIARLRHFAGGEMEDSGNEENSTERFPFEVVLDDPAGNSFVENTLAPAKDPCLTIEKYDRSPTQDMALGLQPSKVAMAAGRIDDTNPDHKSVANGSQMTPELAMDPTSMLQSLSIGRREAVTFTTPCPNCQETAETNMCVTDIPQFKEIVIMSLVCDQCGYRSSDIKPGGAIPMYGTKTTLSIRSKGDLQRELLLSDTAGIEIPEIELELEEGGLGGAYTTVEGLMKKMLDRLRKANPFAFGDAAEKHHLTNDGCEFSTIPLHVKYRDFLDKLSNIGEGRVFPVTLVLNDPLSNSFIGPVPKVARVLAEQAKKDGNTNCYKNHVDHGLVVEVFDRTSEQNEALGLDSLKTENYTPKITTDYGTDWMESNTAGKCFIRGGPDHPHQVAKAPVDSDTTIMGAQ